MQSSNAVKDKRPYELTGAEYALWFDVGKHLGLNAQTAVEQWLCSGRPMIPPHGQKLDEQSLGVIRTLAAQKQLFLPRRAFGCG